MEQVPQLWDVASALAPGFEHDPDEVADVAVAEHARVACADRLRGSVGLAVRARLLTGTAIGGVLVASFVDGVVITDPQATWILPLSGVAWLDVPLRAPVRAAGRERGGVLGAVRELAPGEVVLATVDAVVSRVRLTAVAADHLLVAPLPQSPASTAGDAAAIVPWPAVSWVRSA
jgi:hypothetical protein